MTMNLSNYITNFEQSKRLKELGVKQESLHYWAVEEWSESPSLLPHEVHCWVSTDKTQIHWPAHDIDSDNIKEIYSAFSLQELIEILGERFLKIEWLRDEYCAAAKYGESRYIYYASDKDLIAAMVLLINNLSVEGVLDLNQKKEL